MRHLVLVVLLVSIPAGAVAGGTPFRSLRELHAAIASVEKGSDADAFWRRVEAQGAMPLVFGTEAVFLWRGEGTKLEWRGDFSSWEETPETAGRRLGTTDIWTYERQFPRDARLDYKIVHDGTWDLDPLNPHTQLGGYGPNSEVRMPEWHPAPFTTRRDGVARGTLSADVKFASANVGYVINYRVYTPAGFDAKSSRDLPSLYVTDGSDYWTDGMGGLVVTLDNLIAERRIPPMIVVFVDPWDRRNGVNRREKELIPADDRSCPFCVFLAEELVPAVDAAWPTRRSRESRGILGTSLGGLNAVLMTTRYPRLFGLAGIQSPAMWVAPWVGEEAAAKTAPLRAYLDAGTFEPKILDAARALRGRYARAGTRVRLVSVHEGHSWGQWRAQLGPLLEFLYGK